MIERLKRILISGAIYNAIEVILVVIVGGVHLFGGEVWAPVLWLMFAAAAVWVLLSSTADAEEEARDMILFRDIFYTDFLIGAFLLLMLSTMTMQYGLGYGAIFFVAAIQNLRYSALAYDWIETQDYDDSEGNNLP